MACVRPACGWPAEVLIEMKGMEKTMMRATKWLVCSGAGQYLEIAPKIVGAGFVGGIEWEPNVSRALVRLSEVPKSAMGVIVAPGCLGGDPRESVALMVDFVGAAVTILIDSAPEAPDVEHALDGVDIVIPVGRLFDVLLTLAQSGDPVPRSQVLPVLTNEDLVRAFRAGAPGRQANPQQACLRNDGEAPDAHISNQGSCALRATGSFPKITRDASSTTSSFPFLDSVPQARDLQAAAPREGEQSGVSRERNGSSESPARGDSSEPLANNMPSAPQPSCVPSAPQVRVVGPPESVHVPTVCIASARGGVGKSSIAALMAIGLARQGLKVSLLDLDFQFGTCLGFLGADETDGIVEEVGMGEQICLDARTISRCRASTESGLDAFEFCRLPERSELLVSQAGAIVRIARQGADIAIVDLPSGMNEGVAQVFEVSDRCMLVCDQGALSLESLAAFTSLCGRAGIPLTKLVSVINRCDQRHRDETFLSRARFELQTPQVLHIIDGGAEVTSLLSCGSAGELVSMRNRMALSIAEAAGSICADLGCAPEPMKVRSPKASRRSGSKRSLKGELVPCPS
jgi:MinD-like ATPase involved in chromosome partitioning or flagellar assembly